MNGSQAKEEVSQLIQGLCSMLEEKRASLLQAIEECQQERLASLHYQIQEHQAMLENSGMVGYAQEVLKETDHPCFVQAAKQLHNRYQGTGTRVGVPAVLGLAGARGSPRSHPDVPALLCCRILRATDSLQSFRPAATASFSHFQLDVSRELKLLTDLAFIKGNRSRTPAPAAARVEAQPLRAEQLRARPSPPLEPELGSGHRGMRSGRRPWICRPPPCQEWPQQPPKCSLPCPVPGLQTRGQERQGCGVR